MANLFIAEPGSREPTNVRTWVTIVPKEVATELNLTEIEHLYEYIDLVLVDLAK